MSEKRKDTLIIVGGPKYSGKSSIVKILKQMLDFNISLDEYNFSSDFSTGNMNRILMRASRRYGHLLRRDLSNDETKGNFVFDNIILPEQVFIELNMYSSKFYPFEMLMRRLESLSNKFDVIIIFSYILNIHLYKERAAESGCVDYDYTTACREQSAYLDFIESMKKQHPKIKVVHITTDNREEGIAKQLNDMIINTESNN